MSKLDLELLREAVSGSYVAIRCRTELQPAGGPGDKIFPATYGVDNAARTKYATENYRDGDIEKKRVLIDSVASSANRHELALQEALDAGEISFPNPFIDFTVDDELADLGHLSALQTPHRLADAIFRDSLLDNTLFRLSDLGRAITEANPNAATALYLANPVSLIFGMWDSTGPKGGLGSKFQRAFVSEIVGLGAELGVSVGSRIDPLQIEVSAGPVYKHENIEQTWTLDESEAEKNKDGAVGVGKGKETGRPSAVVHGNVVPSIEKQSGGVTIEKAIHTSVLSLAALRKLRFPTNSAGEVLSGAVRRDAEVAARTALAALTIAAIAYQQENDYDLRSRCLLIPTHKPKLELVPRDGSDPLVVDIDTSSAAKLLASAAEAAAAVGMGWGTTQVRLVPAPKLCDLVKRSRDQLRAKPAGEDAEDE